MAHFISLLKSRYRPGVAHRGRRVIALPFHDRGTRRGLVVSNTARPHFTPGKDPVPILQEAGWAPGPVWTGGKSRPHRDSIPDRPARSQLLYRLSYPARIVETKFLMTLIWRPHISHNPYPSTLIASSYIRLSEIYLIAIPLFIVGSLMWKV